MKSYFLINQGEYRVYVCVAPPRISQACLFASQLVDMESAERVSQAKCPLWCNQ